MIPPARKAILVVSEDWYFLSHRLGLAQFLQREGWAVTVVTQVNTPEDAARIAAAGLRLVPAPLERGRLLAPGDLAYLWRLFRLYRRERPAIVHHVAMKPILYGSIAALGMRGAGVINAFAGLGYLFTHRGDRVRVVRRILMAVFRRLFARARTRVVLQNAQDHALFRDRIGVPVRNLRLVRGAGVDLAAYRLVAHGERARPVVVMVARLLRDKGVREFADAARRLREAGCAVRCLVAGEIDGENPNSLTAEELAALRAEGSVEWLGHREDVAAIYAGADIAVLPSYREGLPKSLLEAMACGLPIVATDTSGCREIVAPEINGLLVPVRDAAALAGAIERLARDPGLRARMGAAGRARVEREFGQEVVFRGIEAIYREVAGG
ncbi:MAG: glycosyltransferase family 4 protein [Opitutaceae bacterium]|nr:glycosyltransferase family 4 protein [Opitutaceae bacterium]